MLLSLFSRVVVRYLFLHITDVDHVEDKQCSLVLSGAEDIMTAVNRSKLSDCAPGIVGSHLSVWQLLFRDL